MTTIKNFDRNGGFKIDGFKEIVPSNRLKSNQFANLFDTLVAHTDLTQNAEVIGNAEPLLSLANYKKVIFSMDLVKVIPKNEQISKFVLAAMLQDSRFKKHCLGYVNGTTVLHLSKKALPDYQIILPRDLSNLKILDDFLSPIYHEMASRLEENMRLSDLMNALLPRLISNRE